VSIRRTPVVTPATGQTRALGLRARTDGLFIAPQTCPFINPLKERSPYTMFLAHNPRAAAQQTYLPRPRRGGPAKRRRGFRLELETVEDRCLLSSYTVTDLTFPGGYLLAAGAVNSLGQVSGRGVGSGVNNAVVWQNGSIINLDPQQLHGISYAVDLTSPAKASDVQVVGDMGDGNVFLWVGGTMYDTGISGSANPGWQLAISNSGVVTGGYHPAGGPSQTHAFVWTDSDQNHIAGPGELRDLNSLIPNATVSAAEDISDGSGAGDHKKVVATALVSVSGGRSALACLPLD
jgi:hypothetical protein